MKASSGAQHLQNLFASSSKPHATPGSAQAGAAQPPEQRLGGNIPVPCEPGGQAELAGRMVALPLLSVAHIHVANKPDIC